MNPNCLEFWGRGCVESDPEIGPMDRLGLRTGRDVQFFHVAERVTVEPFIGIIQCQIGVMGTHQ